MGIEILSVELDGVATEAGQQQVVALLAAHLATQPNPGQLTDVGTAGQTLGGHRVVVSRGGQYVYPATAAELASSGLFVTTGAASTGAPVTVVTQGIVDEPGWSWTPGVGLYAASDGALTHDAAGYLGVVAPVAVAVSPTRIVVRDLPPITLA